MSRVAGSGLAEFLEDWEPGLAEMTRRVDPWTAAAFAGLIGSPPPPLREGDPLPPMWHWLTLLDHPAQSEIGVDGHPAEGPFLPPIPGRRRMFAGGRLRQDAPIPVGAELPSRSSVAAASVKSGRSGELAFVTVRHELDVDSTVGNMMRTWRQRAGSASDRLRRAEAEHEAATQRALALERARIASELHDVVTHNVSVMVVQAGGARRVLDSSPADAREALLAIEDSGRNAMTELRHLLSLLAPDLASSDEVLPPQPGLDLVPELVGGVRSAGLPVSLSVHGARRELSAGLDLAAFRVVQEALTNVLKHAPAASAAVRISYRDEDLLIEVADDGTGLAPRDPASGHGGSGHGGSGQGSSGQGSSGRGLLGLRERIAIYGGSLEAGPRPGGGWRVRATIPLEAAAPGYLPTSAASV